MEQKTLYRKHRPVSFDDMVGQEHITSVLKNAIDNSSFSHAYLFCGPHGVGKTSTARILAFSILGKEYSSDLPLDIIEIDAASNRRIDEVRQLKDRVRLAPIDAKYKVYIIDEVHMLTKEAFNALLKTLEEPPEHVVFILATTEASSLPATIISRTQKHNFRLASEDDISKLLQTVSDQEKLTLDKSSIALIAKHANGSFRDALSILSKVASSSSVSSIEDVLGIPSARTINALIQHLEAKDISSCFKSIDQMLLSGLSVNDIKKELIEACMSNSPRNPDLIFLAKDLLAIKTNDDQVLSMKVSIADYVGPERVVKQKTIATTPNKDDVSQPDPDEDIAVKEENDTEVEEVVESSTTTKEDSVVDEVQSDRVDSSEIAGIQASDWSDFMTKLKKDDRATYTILRMVNANISESTLTLSCKYDLHQRKISEPTFKSKILKLVEPMGIDEVHVIKDEAAINKTVKNDTEMAIKDIMGGGEVVKLEGAM